MSSIVKKINNLTTTALLKRLVDGYSTIYSYEDLKKYSRLDPSFSTLPPLVRDVLIHNFQDLNKLHYDQKEMFITWVQIRI